MTASQSAKPRSTCANCGTAIELISEQDGMWLHVETRKLSCQLYAYPAEATVKDAAS